MTSHRRQISCPIQTHKNSIVSSRFGHLAKCGFFRQWPARIFRISFGMRVNLYHCDLLASGSCRFIVSQCRGSHDRAARSSRENCVASCRRNIRAHHQFRGLVAFNRFRRRVSSLHNLCLSAHAGLSGQVRKRLLKTASPLQSSVCDSIFIANRSALNPRICPEKTSGLLTACFGNQPCSLKQPEAAGEA